MPRGNLIESLTGRSSPGDGITPAKMSREPLATEGEATPGPDHINPYDRIEDNQEMRQQGLPDLWADPFSDQRAAPHDGGDPKTGARETKEQATGFSLGFEAFELGGEPLFGGEPVDPALGMDFGGGNGNSSMPDPDLPGFNPGGSGSNSRNNDPQIPGDRLGREKRKRAATGLPSIF